MRKQINILCLCLIISLLFIPEFASARRDISDSVKPDSSVEMDTAELNEKRIRVKKSAYNILETTRPLCGQNLRNELGFRVKWVEPEEGKQQNHGVWNVTHIFPGSAADQSKLSQGQQIISGDSDLNLFETNKVPEKNQPRQINLKLNNTKTPVSISAQRICDITFQIEPTDGLNIQANDYRITLTRGLLEEISSPDALKGLIAHQIAHLVLEHPSERQIGRLIGKAADIGLLAVGVPTFGILGYAGSNLEEQEQEQVADRLAVVILAKSDGISDEMIRIWEEVKANHPNDFFGRDYLTSSYIADAFIEDHILDDHPVSRERMENLRRWANAIRRSDPERLSLDLENFDSDQPQFVDDGSWEQIVQKPEIPLPEQKNLPTRERDSEDSSSEIPPTALSRTISQEQHRIRRANVIPEPETAGPDQHPSPVRTVSSPERQPEMIEIPDQPRKKTRNMAPKWTTPQIMVSKGSRRKNLTADSGSTSRRSAEIHSPSQSISFHLTAATGERGVELDNPIFNTDLMDTRGSNSAASEEVSGAKIKKLNDRKKTIVRRVPEAETDLVEETPTKVDMAADETDSNTGDVPKNQENRANSRNRNSVNQRQEIPQISHNRKEWYTIQLISLSDKDRARKFVEQIPVNREKIQIWPHQSEDGSTFYRVRLGVLDSRPQAKQYALKLERNGKIEGNYWISKVYR